MRIIARSEALATLRANEHDVWLLRVTPPLNQPACVRTDMVHEPLGEADATGRRRGQTDNDPEGDEESLHSFWNPTFPYSSTWAISRFSPPKIARAIETGAHTPKVKKVISRWSV